MVFLALLVGASVAGGQTAPASRFARPESVSANYCTGSFLVWGVNGATHGVFMGTSYNCSGTLAKVAISLQLLSSYNVTERASGSVAYTNTSSNSLMVPSNNPYNCGSSCANWNPWMGLFTVTFTSSSGWKGTPSQDCGISGDQLQCSDVVPYNWFDDSAQVNYTT
jgi:hypothetical protein